MAVSMLAASVTVVVAGVAAARFAMMRVGMMSVAVMRRAVSRMVGMRVITRGVRGRYAMNMRRRVVSLLLDLGQARMRMGNRRQLAGEKSHDHEEANTATQHDSSIQVEVQV